MVNRDAMVSYERRNLGAHGHWQMTVEVMERMNGAWKWVLEMVLKLQIYEIGYIKSCDGNGGVDPHFSRVFLLNRRDLLLYGEKLVLEKLESPLILFLF